MTQYMRQWRTEFGSLELTGDPERIIRRIGEVLSCVKFRKYRVGSLMMSPLLLKES